MIRDFVKSPAFSVGVTMVLAGINLYQHPHMDAAAAWSSAAIAATAIVNLFATPPGSGGPEAKP